MEAGHRVPPRLLLAALAAGAVPAILAPWLTERALQPEDLARSAAALGVAGVAALLLVRWRWPRALQHRAWLLLPLALAAAPTLAGARLLDDTVSNDERSLLLQAELFASGDLAEPLPRPSCAPVPGAPERLAGLCPLHRRQVLEDPARDRRFSKYPPGAPLALAPAVAAGVPWLSVLAAGLLDVLLVAALARRLGATPLGASLLLVLSPFFLLVQASWQSEVFTAPAVLAGCLLLLAARRTPERRLAAAGAGAACGWVFLVRPLTGVVLALAFLPGLLRRSAARRAPGRKGVLAAAAGGLPFLLLFLAYNRLQTGAWLQTPYGVYARRFGPFDSAGHPVDVFGHGDFLAGLAEETGRAALMLGGVLGLVALGLWGLWRCRRQDGGSFLLLCLLLPCAHAWHWFPGHWAYPGPLYAFECLGLLAVGGAGLLAAAPVRWQAGVAAGVAAGLLLLLPYRAELIATQVARRAAPRRAAAESPPGAVVLLPFAGGAHLKDYTPSRPPWTAGTVFVQELPDPEATDRALETLGLRDRPLFRFLPGSSPGTGRLEPVHP